MLIHHDTIEDGQKKKSPLLLCKYIPIGLTSWSTKPIFLAFGGGIFLPVSTISNALGTPICHIQHKPTLALHIVNQIHSLIVVLLCSIMANDV